MNVYKPTNTLEVLEKAREFLSIEANWLRNGQYHQYKYDHKGEQVEGNIEKACAVGALSINTAFDYSFDRRPKDIAAIILTQAFKECFPESWQATSMTQWNDKKATHDELMQLYDKAIKLAREEIEKNECEYCKDGTCTSLENGENE